MSQLFVNEINPYTGNTVIINGILSATTYQNLPISVSITGGTYSNGSTTFTNNTGGTFTVNGFYTGSTDVFVTGGTYNSNTGIATFTNNTGGTFTLSGFSTSTQFTGGTVTGATNFTGGITANTVSATTYQNLPTDITITGGSYSSGSVVFTNNTGGTFSVTGITDTFTTGFTYSNNTFTISINQGLPNLTANVSTMTGLTVSGQLSATTLNVSSTSNLNGTIISNNLIGATDRIVEVTSGGTIYATRQVISAYIQSGNTAANLLNDTNNWDINGVYTGTTITGTFQGQKHYNNSYYFEAVADNVWIRWVRS